MKRLQKIVAMLLSLCMILSLAACGISETKQAEGETESKLDAATQEATLKGDGKQDEVIVRKDENGNTVVQTADPVAGETAQQLPVTSAQKTEEKNEASATPSVNTTPQGEYNKGVVLVKCEDKFSASALGELSYASAEVLYEGSKWYTVKLTDESKTEEAVKYLAELGTLEKVDYDYIMGVTGPKEEENPNYGNQVNLGLSNIPHGWTVNGKAPGGSPDVVVAVIDTGVDYNHLDLRNNIWVNTAEIPGNGKDDDGNGYIDDINGWDCVGNDNDPMDDNGHGTHVAGIIAAENNKEGGIGVAYNCKVMVLKAGNSSGYFNNSDIAEAIQYAYMNGASVINMSFGGSNISIAVKDALENAYNTCVLVAAAGNDGACNNLACEVCEIVGVSYPAALPYVIGVMSTDKDGKHISSFSNYDHYPYDSIEYEVYAVGEGVGSTWPSNKYACLNGTSMAAPTVSGIAALLRSYYSDRETYSTKFIQSQIVNTGTVNPHYLDHVEDTAHSVADAEEALTKLPKPAVNLYEYFIDDSTSISKNNNANGVIDAGETVRLHVSLHNRGGVASNVNVSIDTYRREIGDEALTDPYFTFVNTTIALSDIGTYSVRESGDKYFEIIVSHDCPNDYLVNFNIRYTYTNGLDEKDKTVYEDDGKQKARFNVSSGYHLPAIITEDTVFTNDRLYIVGETVMIPVGVTVTFEEGCRIQFYDDREYYNSPEIQVYGTLIFEGSKDNMIEIYPSERQLQFGCMLRQMGSGTIELSYVDAINVFLRGSNTFVENSSLRNNGDHVYCYDGGKPKTMDQMDVAVVRGSYIEITKWNSHGTYYGDVSNCYVYMIINNAIDVYFKGAFENNVLCVDDVGTTANRGIAEFRGSVENNLFYGVYDDDITRLLEFTFTAPSKVKNNSFSAGYQKYASQLITNYLGANGNPTIDVYGSCSDASALYPHVEKVEIFNLDGEAINVIGKEEIKVRVTFNRPMDTTKDTFMTFGTIEPYADYKITGAFVSETVWEGSYTLKAQIENGQNFLKVNNACAAEDATKTVLGKNQLHEFTIDTTAALSMNLFAMATDAGIELTWNQDDYATLMGYNIYRSTAKDGNYVKINPSVLLATESSFVDDNAEPGKTYWYTFTVVLSDFSESAPAGKVFCTAVDNLLPTVYHTPVNQGYENNNLVISCTASDNMAIASVVLYYRTIGSEAWKTLAMSKVNDKYNATVFGSELTLAGLEYYIVASDGVNSVSKGSADEPYKVVIKDASALSRTGDVDGNGVVNTKDALMLMQCINGDLILADDAFQRADLNKDGILSSVEALRILQYVNGKVNTLEM